MSNTRLRTAQHKKRKEQEKAVGTEMRTTKGQPGLHGSEGELTCHGARGVLCAAIEATPANAKGRRQCREQGTRHIACAILADYSQEDPTRGSLWNRTVPMGLIRTVPPPNYLLKTVPRGRISTDHSPPPPSNTTDRKTHSRSSTTPQKEHPRPRLPSGIHTGGGKP